MKPLRVLVVDDEPLGRERLRALVARRDDLALVGMCRGGEEAIAAIATEAPDLVFLDVQMPETDGFEVVARVGSARMPPVIFVTAFDQYALAAFEVDAVDYLLKPFEDERFDEAVERVLRLHQRDDLHLLADQLARLVAHRRGGGASKGGRQHFAVHRPDRIDMIPVEAVEWIGAEGAYVRLHCGTETHLVRDSLASLEAGLADRGFIRVHRSTLVRLDRIRTLHPLFRGEYQLELSSGDRVKLSRSYSRGLRARLGL